MFKSSSKHIVVVVGPTGTGKSDLALCLLDDIQGEIISADSRQVYRTIDYVTNKLSLKNTHSAGDIVKHEGFWETNGKRINLYDVVSVEEEYSVDRFVADATRNVDRIFMNSQTPLVVGGTGYYIDSLLGISPTSLVGPDHNLRDTLSELSVEELAKMLSKIDTTAHEIVSSSDWKNKSRLIRYIEVAKSVGSLQAGKKWSPLRKMIHAQKLRVKFIGLTAPRVELFRRADEWVEELFASDQFKREMDFLNQSPAVSALVIKGLVVKHGIAWIKGELEFDEAKRLAKFSLHRYIRRQLVWFRGNHEIVWFDVTNSGWQHRVRAEINRW